MCMKTKFQFYSTYYFANIVDGVLSNPFPYLRNLDGFYGDGNIQNFATPFPKNSALHQFIEFVLSSLIDEEMSSIEFESMQEQYKKYQKFMPKNELEGLLTLPIEKYLNTYEIMHESFADWLSKRGNDKLSCSDVDVDDYYQEYVLAGYTEELIEKMGEEVFFVLFSNRSVLQSFNKMMASVMNNTVIDEISNEYQPYFNKDGILKRTQIPTWAKRAIYFRDRGRCVFCNTDLSGILSLQDSVNFDHIVPLSDGGLNDVTNLQLSCEKCNKKKGNRSCETSLYYEKWF